MNLTSGVQVAQLALKHRQNKHQRQRIVLFAGRLVFSVARQPGSWKEEVDWILFRLIEVIVQRD